MYEFFLQIESLPLFAAFNESLFVYPIILGIHVLGIAFAVGLLGIVDLRLANLLLQSHTQREVVSGLRPWFIGGFIAVLLTGLFLFLAQASIYYTSWVFWGKIVLIVLAGLNALYFEIHYRRNELDRDVVRSHSRSRSRPFLSARASGLTSLGFWVVAIVLGRLLAYF